jgi:hypothetical protein
MWSETGNYGKMGMDVNTCSGDIQQLILGIGSYFVNVNGCAFSQAHVVMLTDNPKRSVQPLHFAHGVYDEDTAVIAITDGVALHKRSV